MIQGSPGFTCKLLIFLSQLKVLNEQINEAGYDHGYSFRVYYLERLNFESGTLKGMMETVLEYWKHADKGKT